MKERKVTNVAASVRQRLLNVAKASERPFQEVLQYYAMERFLYRLAQSPHAHRFVLKGALMFNAWRSPTSRPTKDIDLLGHLENSTVALAAAMSDVCNAAVEPDGILFNSESVEAMIIKEDADYEGMRITFEGTLDNARVAMQIDVGFGDVMYPAPEFADYPTILDHAAPRLRGYARETAVAEKFEAMVKLGVVNSRMKDFYDVWVLSRQFDFDGMDLATAIQGTFAHRGTVITADPAALSKEFSRDAAKATQWRAFLNKSRLSDAPPELEAAVRDIELFLGPIAKALSRGEAFTSSWRTPGPWVTDRSA